MSALPDFNAVVKKIKTESYARGFNDHKGLVRKALHAAVDAALDSIEMNGETPRIIINKPANKKAGKKAKIAKATKIVAATGKAAANRLGLSVMPKFNGNSIPSVVYSVISSQPGVIRKKLLTAVRKVNPKATDKAIDMAVFKLRTKNKVITGNAKGYSVVQ